MDVLAALDTCRLVGIELSLAWRHFCLIMLHFIWQFSWSRLQEMMELEARREQIRQHVARMCYFCYCSTVLCFFCHSLANYLLHVLVTIYLLIDRKSFSPRVIKTVELDMKIWKLHDYNFFFSVEQQSFYHVVKYKSHVKPFFVSLYPFDWW